MKLLRAFSLLFCLAFLAGAGCGRSDPFAFDDFGASAGEGGTDTGGRPNGGSNTGGNFPTGGFSGASGTFTGGSSGTGGFCPVNLVQCRELCVDLTVDPNHCGSCFAQCPPDYFCSNGGCFYTCGELTRCFDICTDTFTDSLNCGRCGNVCRSGTSCSNGQCLVGCPGRQIDCGLGCTDLLTDSSNCGACGFVCADGQICADGACRTNCPLDFSDCGGDCRNLLTDPDNCGACGSVCPRLEVCRDGACDTSCGNLASCNGSCRDLEHDPRHCGACSRSCGSDQVCLEGNCQLVCGPGITNCGGSCRDLRVDPQNCGACGRACGMRQFCSAGACQTIPDTSSYAVGPSPLMFISACGQPGATVVLRSIDDDAIGFGLPWSFRFYGAASQSAWVSSNGLLGFGSANAEYVNQCTFGSVQRTVLAFWDDLLTRTGGVCLATIGSAPNRQIVATWNDASLLENPGTNLTFSIVLSESTDIIDVLYGNMTGGGTLSAGSSATIGLASTDRLALDCCNQACVTSFSGRRYTPILR